MSEDPRNWDNNPTTAVQRNRLALAITLAANPSSLVGSFFHGEGKKHAGCQGCVVAEPAPGVYLCEFFSWLAGESTRQRLVTIDEMTDWLFYDDAEWMNNAYEHGVAQRWERERREAERAVGEAAVPPG